MQRAAHVHVQGGLVITTPPARPPPSLAGFQDEAGRDLVSHNAAVIRGFLIRVLVHVPHTRGFSPTKTTGRLSTHSTALGQGVGARVGVG